ncbi:CDP-glucose 4,6-dehydratase [Synechococcus sp. HK01-R]|nr:CDP-glucose 4,6-dehydratase [Synechococcus sp. HK01-R]
MLQSDFWQGKRVLLTGHTGFKGSWLLLWLQQLGAEVWTYSLEPEGDSSLFSSLFGDSLTSQRWHHRIGNLLDRPSLDRVVQLSQPEVVFHLAAQPLVRRSYQDPVGTWSTNVLGSLHLLESLRLVMQPCSVVMVTTDKVYENQEWSYGYRENDRLGGHDPYSASKAASEIAISSWRSSFCGIAPHQTPHIRVATARAGNVIGGGDWALDRIFPDAIRALMNNSPIPVRNPSATRPWQHVIEPLYGYLRLAEALSSDRSLFCDAFNFGPNASSNRPVVDLVTTILKHWPGHWEDQSVDSAPHEANLLHLQIDKAYHHLGWFPQWDFNTTLTRTVGWYRAVHEGASPLECCLADLNAYTKLLTSS